MLYNYIMQWEEITNIILIAAIAVLGVFALMGLIEWIKRKSLFKVDKELLAMIPSLVIMLITYLIFDKIFILNTRPDGSGKPSFPSSHVMATTTIFLMVMLALPKYIKSKPLRIFLDVIMFVLIILISAGRVLSQMHWVSDVAAGLIFALIFTAIYYLIRKFANKENHE